MTDNGMFDKVAGTAKEVAGKVTGDAALENEGKLEQVEGKVKEVAADAAKAAEGLLDDAKGLAEGVAERVKDALDKDGE
ncbi:CsbD family protein [Eggerthellaceae bacterium zg-997]|nr:CsbD family protein [Eggerthellaceae bacterium zg-997]